jgi:hypothetical protein
MKFFLLRAMALTCLMFVFSGVALAASFDCGKARRPLEKLICSSPELDAADTRMGEVFKQVNAGFPLKGFLLATQRVFLSGYPYCMTADNGKALSGAEAARRCAMVVRARTAEIEAQALAKVYSNAGGKFTHDSLAILVYTADGRKRIRLWGNWMPDAYDPKPFPDGSFCDFDEELKSAKSGYMISMSDEAVFSISDAAINISEYIMCTPRTGIGSGTYRRVR